MSTNSDSPIKVEFYYEQNNTNVRRNSLLIQTVGIFLIIAIVLFCIKYFGG